jgi:hypothetical protein
MMMTTRASKMGRGQQQAWEDIDNKPGLGQGGTLLTRRAREATTATTA